MKKLFALLLALTMVFSLAATAFAEETTATFKITIPSDDGHTYDIYQIFTGDYSEAEDGTNRTLSNIVWGKNGTGTEGQKVEDTVLNALAAASGTDKEKLAVIGNYVNLTGTAYLAGASGEVSVEPGYYLLKDVQNLPNADDAYTTFIVMVVDDVTVTRKAAKPSVDKQVHDEAGDAESGANDGWGETADHAINESFQFKLIATLTADADYDAYTTYQVKFTDTMSAGITFESIESVTVDDVPFTSNQYTCTAEASQSGGEWSLTISNVKVDGVNLTDGAEIVVIYNAHLNENAAIGNVDTNKNTVYLQYSNNPNAGGENDLGQTAPDTVWVFTYKIDSTKYHDAAESGKELEGAGFTLYDSTGAAVKLVYDSTKGAYRPASTTEIEADASKEENQKIVVTEMTSAENGKFNVVGLDAGTYTLKETTVPAGYNKCDDITIVISATHSEAESEDTASTTITMKKDQEDAVSAEGFVNAVINKSGATLPETGGMGTTLFYIVGGIMVAAAVVLLVTKKRMGAEG